jgi:hypothetical protein
MMDQVQKKEIMSVSSASLSKPYSVEFIVNVLDFKLLVLKLLPDIVFSSRLK